MNTWITADWHLGHDKLVEMGVRPPGTSEQIETYLIESVQPGDTLVNLGDVYLGRAGEAQAFRLIKNLLDYVVSTILTRGNHDTKRMAKLMTMGWDWVCESTTIVYNGKLIIFSHEPIAHFDGDFNIHGHLHQIDGHRGSLIRDGRHILISMELMDYRPITLDRLLEIGATPAWIGGRFVAADLTSRSGC